MDKILIYHVGVKFPWTLRKTQQAFVECNKIVELVRKGKKFLSYEMMRDEYNGNIMLEIRLANKKGKGIF